MSLDAFKLENKTIKKRLKWKFILGIVTRKTKEEKIILTMAYLLIREHMQINTGKAECAFLF